VAPDRQRETHANLCMVRNLLDAAVSEAETAWRLDGSGRRQPGELVEVA
jgi:hypothetical protein